jgi:hypothetical protein
MKKLKRNNRLTALLLSLAVLVTSIALPATLAAQTTSPSPTSSGQALEIAPLILNLTANPGQKIKAQISIRNISKTNLIVTGQVNDFIAAGEDGTPKILTDEDASNPFSIKDWVGTLPSLTMVPRQIKTLNVDIIVPSSASPGGHYGVIRFTGAPPELKGTGVSLSASVGTLVFLRVNGNVKENLAISEFSVNKDGKKGKLFESTPLNFVEKIKNAGNIHEQPAGQVTITDMFGKKVATVNVNLPPRNILPGSTRKFEQPLDNAVIGNKRLFGRYKASLKLTYGENKQTVMSSLTFWVIPYRLLAIIIVLLIGGFFGLRFLIRRYNRRIIAKAQNRR